jgi:Arc/MetJ family transcription regulator
MKTTIDIPDDLMKDAMRITNATTKRDAVVGAMEALVRQDRKREVLAMLGTFENMMTLDELMEMREERGKYAPRPR